jgi:hypothetical protein
LRTQMCRTFLGPPLQKELQEHQQELLDLFQLSEWPKCNSRTDAATFSTQRRDWGMKRRTASEPLKKSPWWWNQYTIKNKTSSPTKHNSNHKTTLMREIQLDTTYLANHVQATPLRQYRTVPQYVGEAGAMWDTFCFSAAKFVIR